jgi:hypothetical protein
MTTIRARHRLCLTAAILSAVSALAFTANGNERGDDMIVTYDQSQIVRLPRPAREIIIGNPTIADVSVQGGNMLVVTGKTFGITNFIALDADRKVIKDTRIVVQRDEARVVNLHKAGKRQSYNCTPQCNPMITVGDDSTYFDTVTKNSQAKIKFSEGGAESNQNSNSR